MNPPLIISTHSHSDHTDSVVNDSYDCPKIMYTKEDIQLQDFHIFAFFSSHDNDNVSEDTYNVMLKHVPANEKGFNLIEQLNPRIVIPTYYSSDALEVLAEKYGPIRVCDNMLSLSIDDLPDSSVQIYVITNTHDYR